MYLACVVLSQGGKKPYWRTVGHIESWSPSTFARGEEAGAPCVLVQMASGRYYMVDSDLEAFAESYEKAYAGEAKVVG